MRNANVTPSGTPASTKPMNSGTAEQEQNGVMMPNPAAAVAPTTTLRPASVRRTRSGDTNERRKLTSGDDADQQQQHLGQVEQEERDRGAEALARVQAQHVGREPVDRGREQDPGDEPGGDARGHAPARTGTWARWTRERRHRRIARSASHAAASMAASSRS